MTRTYVSAATAPVSFSFHQISTTELSPPVLYMYKFLVFHFVLTESEFSNFSFFHLVLLAETTKFLNLLANSLGKLI